MNAANNTEKPTLHLLMGLPGSGKTTLAKTIEHLTGARRLTSDEYRLSLFNKPTFSQQEHDQLYDNLDAAVESSLSSGQSVIYDANLNRLEHRQQKYVLAKKYSAQVKLWWVHVPQETAKTRRVQEQDERLLPDGETAARMFDRVALILEVPTADEQPTVIDGTRITDEYIAALL